jgi:hypothetical protein
MPTREISEIGLRRTKNHRRSRETRLTLENLEARLLLSGLPADVATAIAELTPSASLLGEHVDTGYLSGLSATKNAASLASPTSPEPLSLTVKSSTRIDLRWSNSRNENGYRICQWKDTADGWDWVQIATARRNATSYSVNNLSPNATYYFKIQAFNGRGIAETNWKSATTATAALPTSPEPLSLTVKSSTRIDLRWSNSRNEDGYKICQWKDTANGWDWVQIATARRNATSYSVNNLSPNSTYYFKVQAFNGRGIAETNRKSATTTATVALPTSPKPLTLTVKSSTRIDLKWTNSQNEDGYKVCQWKDTANGWDWVQIATASRNATSYSVNNLSPNSTYYFKVQAFNGRGIAETNWKSATTGGGSSSFMLTTAFGGTWCDADKSFTSQDSQMCWAAAASNMLEWTGWGKVNGMTNTDSMFKYFQDHWTNEGGDACWGCGWWFCGFNWMPGESGGAKVDVSGGGFFKNYAFTDYVHVPDFLTVSTTMDNINSYLRAGYAVELGITTGAVMGHAITCWGYDYAPGNNSSYTGVWVTDSDDGVDGLKNYQVRQSNGRWYLSNYDDGSYFISRVVGLARKPGNLAAGAVSGTSRSGSKEAGLTLDASSGAAAWAAGIDSLARAGALAPTSGNAAFPEGLMKQGLLPMEAANRVIVHVNRALPRQDEASSSLRDRRFLAVGKIDRADKADDGLNSEGTICAGLRLDAIDAVLASCV